MSIRLSKASKNLNIRMKDAVEFLHKKGHKIEFDPNFKLSDDLYFLLLKEFKVKDFLKYSTANTTDENLVQIEKNNTSTFTKLEKKKFTLHPTKNKKEVKKKEGVIKNTHDLYGFINYKNEDLFFHQSAVKNKIQVVVGDKVSFIVKPSDQKAGKFVADQIEIIEKSPNVNSGKISNVIQTTNSGYTRWNNKIYSIPKSFIDDIKLISGVDESHFEEILIEIESFAKNNNFREANQLIEILKLDNTRNYSLDKLNSNRKFWFLWFGDKDTNSFQKLLKEFTDEEILKKIVLAQRKDENFISRVAKLYANLPISIMLRLWLNDIYGKFDYYQFSNYYFTLNSTERRLFNKKAKAMMSEEIKTSMLKMKEPWKLIETINNDTDESIQIFSATWKSIWFRDGYIMICIDKESKFTDCYNWNFSEEKMNLLYEYISGRKLRELKITVVNDKIKDIEGLEDLEEVIWKIEIQKEIETGVIGNNILNKSGSIKIPANMVLRNRCIQFLNRLQLSELEPTRVIEKAYNLTRGGISVDVSLLYSIPINYYENAIIWESLELEKAKRTHIFKCGRDEFKSIFNDIEVNLSSQIKIRSKLNSSDYVDVNYQKKLRYITGINHDNLDYQKWESDLFEVLPELKEMAI